jgi:hypothetical protein
MDGIDLSSKVMMVRHRDDGHGERSRRALLPLEGTRRQIGTLPQLLIEP